MKIDVREGVSFNKLNEGIRDFEKTQFENVNYLVMNQETFKEYEKLSEPISTYPSSILKVFSGGYCYHGYKIAISDHLKYGEVDIV